MRDENSSNTPKPSEEVDLGQLFIMLKKGTRRLVTGLLRLFLYLKKNSIKLIVLIVLGSALGIILSTYGDRSLKTAVIVKPNFESKNYLYDIVNEVHSNIISRDKRFFKKIGIDVKKLKGFRLEIEPIEDENESGGSIEDMKYLELLLENFEDESFAREIVRAEILKKSIVNYKITFFYNDIYDQSKHVPKLLEYMNNNEYYNEIVTIHRANVKSRIEKNKVLIEQIDELISNYSEGLAKKESRQNGGAVYLDSENSLDVSNLLILKNKLIKELEEKKIALLEQDKVIKIINLGSPQKEKQPFLLKKFVMFPILFVGLFFLVSLLIRINKKAKEIEI